MSRKIPELPITQTKNSIYLSEQKKVNTLLSQIYDSAVVETNSISLPALRSNRVVGSKLDEKLKGKLKLIYLIRIIIVKFTIGLMRFTN